MVDGFLVSNAHCVCVFHVAYLLSQCIERHLITRALHNCKCLLCQFVLEMGFGRRY